MAGGFHHSLACTEDGEVLARGRCDDAQLGITVDLLSAEDLERNDSGRPRSLTVPTIMPGLDACHVAAGIDDSISAKGEVSAWGFPDSYRTGLSTEESVEMPTLLRGRPIRGVKFSSAGCGGTFSVVAGPAPRAEVELDN